MEAFEKCQGSLPSLGYISSCLETYCPPLYNRKLIFPKGSWKELAEFFMPHLFHSNSSPGPPGPSHKDSRCWPDFQLSSHGESVCPYQLLHSGLSCGSGSFLYICSIGDHKTFNKSILFPTCSKLTTSLNGLSWKYKRFKTTHSSSQCFTE